jgi:putative DNA primase/helicase
MRDGHRWKRVGSDKALLPAAKEQAEHHPDSDPNALIAQAKSFPDITLDPSTLDSDPYTLCTPAGIVDLRTGQLHKPDPARDFHSRVTSVAPQVMPTPRWLRFLADTFGDDAEGQEMIDFLRRLFGYSITGDVGVQVLPFLYGQGGSGKSVLLDTVVQVLGDYASAAPPGFLLEHNTSTEDTAELHGRRLIVCSELKANERFDDRRIRLLTSGNRIKAERIRGSYFFKPTHHLWLLGNHCPEVAAGGIAFRRRIRLVPFTRTVPASRCVDNLAYELVHHEGPGILHWLIEGASRYLATRDSLEGPHGSYTRNEVLTRSTS